MLVMGVEWMRVALGVGVMGMFVKVLLPGRFLGEKLHEEIGAMLVTRWWEGAARRA